MQCVYDELFSDDMGVARGAIEACFRGLYQMIVRNYTGLLSAQDVGRLITIRDRGDIAAHLAFFLTAIVHEHALRDEILAMTRGDESVKDKILAYHRLLSIATRSLYETAFTDANAPVLVGRFLQICTIAWRCLDAATITNLADGFGARSTKQVVADNMPPMSTTAQLDEVASRIRREREVS